MALEITSLTKGGPKITVSSAEDQAFVTFAQSFSNLDAVAKKGAFGRFRGDVIQARMSGNANGALCQACWNAICRLFPDAPKEVNGNFPLPEAGSQKGPVVPKQPVPTLADPSGLVYDNWKQTNQAQIALLKAFEHYQPEDKDASLSDNEWNKVVDSVFLLGEKYPGFTEFFQDIAKVKAAVDSDPNFKMDVRKIRLRALLRKMVPNPNKGRKDADIDNYKGACSEILDVFRAMQIRHPDAIRIAVPDGHKEFEPTDVAGYLLTKPQGAPDTWKPLLEQDIDRTEVHQGQNGKVKFYIEVKSDVHTAVEKHQKTTDQLDRIVAVVKNRARKPGNATIRRAAVSIANPDNWLELFTTPTARNYCKREFWLFIDRRIISPQKLEEIDKEVWAQACQGKPYPTNKPSVQELGTLAHYFQTQKATFPKPSVKIPA